MRYIVVKDGDILRHAETIGELEQFIQGYPANTIEVFEKRFVTESVLCDVGYEENNYGGVDLEHEEMEAN